MEATRGALVEEGVEGVEGVMPLDAQDVGRDSLDLTMSIYDSTLNQERKELTVSQPEVSHHTGHFSKRKRSRRLGSGVSYVQVLYVWRGEY